MVLAIWLVSLSSRSVTWGASGVMVVLSVVLAAATVSVGDASIIRSASWANWSSTRVPAEGVRTILTLVERCWRKSSLNKVASTLGAMSPSSCCIRQSICDGVCSPRSSAESRSWSLRCSEAVVLSVSWAFRVSYSSVTGGVSRRLRTSVTYCGSRQLTLETVIPLVPNCASI